MDESPAPTPLPGPPPSHLLRCHLCGRTVAVTGGDVERYIRAGWPVCCGEVMSVFVEAFRPPPRPK